MAQYFFRLTGKSAWLNSKVGKPPFSISSSGHISLWKTRCHCSILVLRLNRRPTDFTASCKPLQLLKISLPISSNSSLSALVLPKYCNLTKQSPNIPSQEISLVGSCWWLPLFVQHSLFVQSTKFYFLGNYT